jgi:Protein of unknown function (DUF2860)
MNQRFVVFTASLLGVIPTVNSENLKENPGWEVELNLNVGHTLQTSQLNTESDNEVTNNLNNSGKSTNSLLVLPLYHVEYTFDNLNTQIYLGNSESNIARGSLADELGFVHRFRDDTVFTIAYAFESEGVNETWQDPFLVGQKRVKTDETYEGIRVRADYIGGLPLSLEYGIAQTQVDKERSGQAQGLSAAQRRRLERDAETQWITLEGFVPFGESLIVIPGVSYSKADADGNSNSFDGYGADLTLMANFHSQYLAANIGYAVEDYQASHPVFNKTREDKSISTFITYGYEEPFGWHGVTFTLD